jgi:pimeloyl-ACP methyl ester carboxylesterase
MTATPRMRTVLGLVAMLACAAAQGATPASHVELAPCKLPELDTPARCGELRLPENPELPQGRQLRIAFAVVPATGARALPDPIVPLMGGPGEDTLSAAGVMAERFHGLRDERDLLLVDQRGTGQSSALRCHLHDPGNAAQNLHHLMPPAAVQACGRELARNADLTQYTYLHFARDLEAVRIALGYGPLNLSAGSYGTRAAQVYLRAYPDSVRTAYMGSVVPIDVVTPLTMAKASQALFESTLDSCAAESGCRAAFPRLRDEFDQTLERLDAGSVQVAVPGSTTVAPVGRGRYVEWLRSRLYRPGTAAQVPWLIHQAHAGNWSPVVDGIFAQAREIDAAYGFGLFYSITCAEDIAFMREGDIEASSGNTFLGDYRVRQQQAACEHWPKATLPKGYRDPIHSPVPTMFVSGDLDAASPLWFTGRVAPGFANRVEIVARGQGHTEWSDCIGALYEGFVRSGSAQGIDPSACPAVPRPPFRTQ